MKYLSLDFSIYVEHPATILQSHPDGLVSLFDKKKKTYYLLDVFQKSLKQKIPLAIAKGENPEFGRISLATELPRFAYVGSHEEQVLVVDAKKGWSATIAPNARTKIESVHLTTDGERLYVGGRNGLISLWDVKERKILAQISKHHDFVYLIQESPCQKFIVSVGYDRSIFIYNQQQKMRGRCVHVASSLPRAILFLADHYVAIGKSSGDIVILDCLLGEVVRRFRASYEEIIAMALFDERHLFFLSRFGKIGVVDFYKGETLNYRYLPHEKGYASMSVETKEQRVILSTQDGYIHAYSLAGLGATLEGLVERGEIVEAYDLLSNHPHLLVHQSAMMLEARLEIDLLRARVMAEEGQLSEMQRQLQPYLKIPEKRMVIQRYMDQWRQLSVLKEHAENFHYLRAYSTLQVNPLLKESGVAKSLEAGFVKALLKSKELLKRGQRAEAERVMFPYKAINKFSKGIRELFLKPLVVDALLEAIEQENYELYFKLKKQYSLVQFFPEARDFEKRGDELYFEFERAIYRGEMEQARKCAQKLLLFPKGRDRIAPWIEKLERFMGKMD